jgi:hypothetical protein
MAKAHFNAINIGQVMGETMAWNVNKKNLIPRY